MAAAAGGDADRREDNYLACKVYKSHLGDKSTKYPGFITFTHEDGQHYFGVLNAAGDDLRFRSEGYPSTGARDNGIESVQKNIDNEARYSTFERGGKHFVVLKAGNHQEIARSCPYDDAAAAAGWFPGALAAAAAALAAAPAIAAAMPDMAMSAPAVEKVTAAPKVPVPTPKIEAAYTPPVEVAASGGCWEHSCSWACCGSSCAVAARTPKLVEALTTLKPIHRHLPKPKLPKRRLK
jgi:uncharacterized protein YegP (UPF0339 family)